MEYVESKREVQVVCPRCNSTGYVPWDRLDRVLQCAQCESWYRLDSLAKMIEISPPDSKLSVSVRTSFSDWRVHDVTVRRQLSPAVRWRSSWRRLDLIKWVSGLSGVQSVSFLGGGVAFVILVGWLMTGMLSAATETSLPPLPVALEDRAPLLAKAWLAKDLPQMLRLTEPARDRELRRWLASTQAPLVKDLTSSATVEVASVERGKGDAKVSVRISQLNGSGSQADAMLRQTWVQRDGTWYFLPSAPPTKKVRTRG